MVEHGCSKLKVSLMGFALTRKKELSAVEPRRKASYERNSLLRQSLPRILKTTDGRPIVRYHLGFQHEQVLPLTIVLTITATITPCASRWVHEGSAMVPKSGIPVERGRGGAAGPGFEPGLSDSESLVLPLHHPAM
jgi:hypothetical protein